MKKYIFSICSFLFSLSLCQQQQNENYIKNSIDIFRKTPDEAAFSKYIDIPSGSYTGVANFSIPLYSFQVDGIEFPIEINYNTYGIKVDEIASRVGLGWSLNVGNIHMTRSTYGLPDLPSGKRLRLLEMTDDEEVIDNVGVIDETDTEFILLNSINKGILGTYEDLNPDIFSYNIGNLSGKFIIDSDPTNPNTYKLHTIPFTKELKSEKDQSGNLNTLIDGSGNKFIFSIYNTSEIVNRNCKPTEPNDIQVEYNYRIGKVLTYLNKEINFIYNERSKGEYATSITENKRLWKKNYGGQPLDIPMDDPAQCINYTYSRESVLSEIRFPEGRISFIYQGQQGERLDLPDELYLKFIEVRDLNGSLIKKIEFKYSYFQSASDGGLHNQFQTKSTRGLAYRLKLEEVIINEKEKYEFTYYESYNNKTLPHRLSNAQDFWGVYNGKDENQTKIATTKYTIPGDNISKVYLGGNLYPDINYGKLGNLKSIKYPTGGVMEVEYESDEFDAESYEPWYDYIQSPIETTYADVKPNQPFNHTPHYFTISENSFNHTVIFQDGIHLIDEDYNDDEDINPSGQGEAGCALTLYHVVNNQNIEIFTVSTSVKKHHMNLPPGNYFFEISPPMGYTSLEEAILCEVKFKSIQQNIYNNDRNRKAGTIRIKKITKKDFDSDLYIREYKYHMPNNPNVTSGRNFSSFGLSSLKFSNGPLDQMYNYYYETLSLKNNPGWNLSTVQGKSIGYRYVYENYVNIEDQAKNYKKLYNFKNDDLDFSEDDFDENFNEYLNDPYNDYNPYRIHNNTFPVQGHFRGKLLEEKYMNEDGVVVKHVKYNYETDNYFNRFSSTYVPTSPSLIGIGLYTSIKKVSCDNFGLCTYTLNTLSYPIRNYWIKQTKIETKEYDIAGNLIMENEEEMEYSPNYNHTFLSSKITENSFGNVDIVKYYYPEDLPSKPFANQLIQKNRISQPLVTKTLTKVGTESIPITEFEIEYGNFNFPNDITHILPKYIYSKKGENITPLEDRKISYESYDALGNLKEYKLENGTSVSIIWGYNGLYPIAKVEGLSYAQIANNSSIQLLISKSNDGSITMNDFNFLRELDGALVTSYIYRPLVGIQSIMQPNGQIVTYSYDDLQRLETIRDHNGNIVKHIIYEFRD